MSDERQSEADDEPMGGSPTGGESLMIGVRKMTEVITEATRATIAAKKKASDAHSKNLKQLQSKTQSKIASSKDEALESIDQLLGEREKLMSKMRLQMVDYAKTLSKKVGELLKDSAKELKQVQAQAHVAGKKLGEQAEVFKATADAELNESYAKHKAGLRIVNLENGMSRDLFASLDKNLAAFHSDE